MRDLEKDLELCNAATPGEWELEEWPETHEVAVVCRGHSRGEPPICVVDAAEGRANAQFFVQAHSGWPEAIKRAMAAEARVRELEEENRQLRDVLRLARSVLYEAWLYRGYQGGPLREPAAETALRHADMVLERKREG